MWMIKIEDAWWVDTRKDAQHHWSSGKCRSKPQRYIISHLSEWLLSRRQQTSVGKTMEKREPSCTVSRNVSWWRSWSWTVLWRPTRPSRINTQKRCPFHYRGLECKSRKSRNTWSNRKIWPWSTEWSTAKTNRVIPREHTGHSKHPLPKTQEKTLHMDITRWSTPKSDWLYSLQPRMEKLYTVSKNKTRSWLWFRSWTPYCQIQTEIEESGENH